jgi:nitrate reductase delta subunit
VRRPTLEPPALAAFAEILSYPGSDPAPLARRCLDLMSDGEARVLLGRFLARAERAGPFEMEELFTSTFDLRPACAPYLGHQLCGETPQRGAFLVRLAEVYREEGFRAGGELPDHLSVVLRFLAEARPGPVRDDLLRDGLLPALDRMLAELADAENPYRAVLAALRAALAPDARAAAPTPAPEEARP